MLVTNHGNFVIFFRFDDSKPRHTIAPNRPLKPRQTLPRFQTRPNEHVNIHKSLIFEENHVKSRDLVLIIPIVIYSIRSVT